MVIMAVALPPGWQMAWTEPLPLGVFAASSHVQLTRHCASAVLVPIVTALPLVGARKTSVQVAPDAASTTADAIPPAGAQLTATTRTGVGVAVGVLVDALVENTGAPVP